MAETRQRPLLVGGERLASPVTLARGGGKPYHPFTEEQARERLAPRATALRENAEAIPPEFRADRVVFQADMLANYLANSHFPSSLLNHLGLQPLGSRTIEGEHHGRARDPEPRQSKSLVLAADADALRQMERFLSEQPSGRTARAAMNEIPRISDLRIATEREVVLLRDPIDMTQVAADLVAFEAVLHPNPMSGQAVSENDSVYKKWLAFVASLDGEVREHAARPVGRLTFVPVRMPAHRAPEAAAFNPLRALRPMPVLRPRPTFTRSAARVQPPASTTPVSNVEVAVFDGGADSSQSLFHGCVTEADLISGPAKPDEAAHGDVVTSTLLYGLTSDGEALEQPPAKVTHYRSLALHMPADRDLYWLLDKIVEVVKSSAPHIVNLSIGPDRRVEDDTEPDRWTTELDKLAYEYGTCFLVAVGNNGQQDAATGLNRVMVPADMANGLAVGACNVPCPDGPWKRADYSAVGPGRSTARVRPAVVAFGGAAGQPFRLLGGDGTVYDDCGTSYATPLVGNSLLRLTAELGADRATSNNFRAFAVHFASMPEGADGPSDESGWGRALGNYSRILECSQNEVHVLYEGVLERDRVMSHRLPFPDGLTGFNLEMAATLAITAPTDAAEPPEYTEACLEPTFRPHQRKYVYIVDGKPKTVDIATDKDKIDQYHGAGIAASHSAKSKPLGNPTRHETEAREAGKWETVRKFGPFVMQSRSLYQPTIDLAYLHRQEGLLIQTPDPIEYSMLITLRARRYDVPLYDRVIQQFDVLNDYRAVAHATAQQQT